MDRKQLYGIVDRATLPPEKPSGPFAHMPVLNAFKPAKPRYDFSKLTDDELQALIDYADNNIK